MFSNDFSSEDFVRSPDNCGQLGLSCQSCTSEAAERLAQVSPGMRPSGAVMLFRIMFDQPVCRVQQDSFLHSYQQVTTCYPATELVG